MNDYELKEIRQGHFVKISNGEVIGRASKGEVITRHWAENWPNVDSGLLELTVALSAVSAVIAVSESPVTVRICSALAFTLSVLATFQLYLVYFFVRMPRCISEFINFFDIKDLTLSPTSTRLALWMVFAWPPVSFVRMQYAKDEEVAHFIAEIGYVLIFWTTALLAMFASGYILASFQ